MGTKLYVGNLSFNTTENELQELFAQAGAVQEVTLMQDKFTGKSRGFAFVTMGSDEDAQNAISKLNGQTIEGRPLTVNEARPREPRPPGGGGGRGYGGGGGGWWIRRSSRRVASEEATQGIRTGPSCFVTTAKLRPAVAVSPHAARSCAQTPRRIEATTTASTF